MKNEFHLIKSYEHFTARTHKSFFSHALQIDKNTLKIWYIKGYEYFSIKIKAFDNKKLLNQISTICAQKKESCLKLCRTIKPKSVNEIENLILELTKTKKLFDEYGVTLKILRNIYTGGWLHMKQRKPKYSINFGQNSEESTREEEKYVELFKSLHKGTVFLSKLKSLHNFLCIKKDYLLDMTHKKKLHNSDDKFTRYIDLEIKKISTSSNFNQYSIYKKSEQNFELSIFTAELCSKYDFEKIPNPNKLHKHWIPKNNIDFTRFDQNKCLEILRKYEKKENHKIDFTDIPLRQLKKIVKSIFKDCFDKKRCEEKLNIEYKQKLEFEKKLASDMRDGKIKTKEKIIFELSDDNDDNHASQEKVVQMLIEKMDNGCSTFYQNLLGCSLFQNSDGTPLFKDTDYEL